MSKIICLAGFGDNTSMFEPLLETRLADRYEIILFNLPGFGAPSLGEKTTLANLANAVSTFAIETQAEVVLAHSVASIIASLAVLNEESPLTQILSLEGNLTAEDAYFSGTAADFDNPDEFRVSFLSRLKLMIAENPIIERYRDNVIKADQQVLWELGCDARYFSNTSSPGEILLQAPSATYFYNPANVPATSLAWLETHALPRVQLDNTSHWASVDQPNLLASKIIDILDQTV